MKCTNFTSSKLSILQIPENDEEFALVLTGATQGARVVNTNFSVVIRANDAPIRFLQVSCWTVGS